MRVPRLTRGLGKAAPTIQVHDLPWGLRVGLFAENGPATGNKRGTLVPRRRRMAISMALAGAAGICVAGIVYGLVDRPLKVPVASSDLPSREWIALARVDWDTPQLQVAPSGQTNETLVRQLSSSETSSANFSPAPGSTSDTQVIAAQHQSPTSIKRLRKRRKIAYAKRAVVQNGVPTRIHRHVQPQRDRSDHRRVHRRDQGTIAGSFLDMMFSW